MENTCGRENTNWSTETHYISYMLISLIKIWVYYEIGYFGSDKFNYFCNFLGQMNTFNSCAWQIGELEKKQKCYHK